MTDSEIFEPFREYLLAERRGLLTRLDEIERLLGVYPRTSAVRKEYSRKMKNKNKESLNSPREDDG